MKNKYKELLKEEISKSPISLQSKKLWYFFLELGSLEECEAIYEAIYENEDNLILLNTHLKNKLFDMKKENKEVWNKTIQRNPDFAVLVKDY